MYITDRDGSSPREVLTAVTTTFPSVTSAWHPDGHRISVWGKRGTEGWSFATVPIDGGPVQYATLSVEARRWLDTNGVTLGRFVWSRTAKYLYFEGASDHIRNLWRVEVNARSSAWIGVPERLTTTAAAQDRDLVLSTDGRHLAFVSRTDETRLWSFPLARGGAIAADGQPIAGGDSSDLRAAFASDGDRMVYQSVRRGGYSELRSLSLLDRREHLLTSGTDPIEHVIWSHDGQRVGYWTRRKDGASTGRSDRSEFVVLNPAGGTETQYELTGAQSNLVPFDWAPDGRTILGTCGRPGAVCSLDLSALKRTPVVLASDPGFDLLQAHFSPDARWIVFVAQDRKDRGVSKLYVMPASGGAWIPVSDGRVFDDKPRWSSDGTMLYYLSSRGAFLNVWARRFEPRTGEPVGEPVRITSFTSGRRLISPDRINRMEMDIGPDRLVLPVTESSSQIWVLDGVDR